MAYTPQLSDAASATLRRIAWALDKPMTRTMNTIFIKLPNLMDWEKVCESCRNPSACNICGFNGNEAA
jgi:recombinational DNA repair protein RecR